MRNGGVLLVLLLSALAAGGDPGTNAPASPSADRPSLDDALARTRKDVDISVRELEKVREAIDAERVPLAGRVEELEQQVSRLRERVERVRRIRELGEKDAEALTARVGALEEDCRFVHTLCSEYRRSLETRATSAERGFIEGRLGAVDGLLDRDSAAESLPEMARALLEMAESWNAGKGAGLRVRGEALDEQGVRHEGHFAVLGPVAFFSDDTGNAAGMAVTRLGHLLPSIYDRFDPSVRGHIARMVAGEESSVPVDVTGGDAVKVREAGTSLVEHLKSGGPVMVPLLAVGLVALVLVVAKLIQMGRMCVQADAPTEQILSLLHRSDVEGSRRLAAGLRSPLSGLLLEGIEMRAAPREHMEEILHEHILTCVPRLERHLGTLAVLGGIAPLLGLLGTVTGMIHTFQLVTIFGTGDAKVLSSGISEALVTTEVGLTIAIPVLLVHAFLARRVRIAISCLEDVAARFVNGLTLGTGSRGA